MAHIFVIAGHGAGDPGACGNGYQEAERVRALAQRIKAFGGDNVTLGDVNRNYYADKGILNLNISKDWQIIELHMDSAAASARGAHVIIKQGFNPDAYDNALANLVGSIFPGRSNLIVGRSDLANPNRAAQMGYSYRLVEFGFISNATDVSIFNSKMDEIAKGVVEAFQNTAANAAPATPAPSVPVASTPSGSAILEVDGSFGPATVRRSQQYLKTTVDGEVSNQWAMYEASNPGLAGSCWHWYQKPNGKGSEMVRAMQAWAGMPADQQDGEIGPNTIRAIQTKLGTTVDGYVSLPSEMVKAWQTYLNNH